MFFKMDASESLNEMREKTLLCNFYNAPIL
jgi:hypothetical protein